MFYIHYWNSLPTTLKWESYYLHFKFEIKKWKEKILINCSKQQLLNYEIGNLHFLFINSHFILILSNIMKEVLTCIYCFSIVSIHVSTMKHILLVMQPSPCPAPVYFSSSQTETALETLLSTDIPVSLFLAIHSAQALRELD